MDRIKLLNSFIVGSTVHAIQLALPREMGWERVGSFLKISIQLVQPTCSLVENQASSQVNSYKVFSIWFVPAARPT